MLIMGRLTLNSNGLKRMKHDFQLSVLSALTVGIRCCRCSICFAGMHLRGWKIYWGISSGKYVHHKDEERYIKVAFSNVGYIVRKNVITQTDIF